MKNRGKILWMLTAAAILSTGAVFFTHRSEGRTQSAAPEKEIVVPIGEVDRFVLAEGDSLRKAHKYREAITSYQRVLGTQGVEKSVRAEAEYDIGLSRTWLGEYDAASAVFTSMLDTYRDNPDAVGYAQFCLAWIEVQQGKLREAITRLEGSLAMNAITDRELAARTRYLIGKTHLMFLNDTALAQEAFRKVREEYPDTKIAHHPYIAGRKEK